MMVMIVIVASAGATLSVLVMMLMLMVMMTATALLVMLVVMMTAMALLVMLVMVVTASALLAMLVVMVSATAFLVMLVVVMTAMAFLIVVMVMMLMLMLQMLKLLCESIALFHSGENSRAVKLIPRSCNNNCLGVIFLDNMKRLFKLRFLCGLCMRENDAGCVLDLIAEELAEVLHIHLAFVRINNGSEGVKLCLLAANCGSRLDNVGELTNARGLNNNSVGVILLENLAESL
jgi:hypothetical protein